MSGRRIVALAVPLAVLFFALGFVVGLEVRRGPNWRLELEGYVAGQAASSEAVRVEAVVRARRPGAFTPSMGTAARPDGVTPTFPPRAVRCALVVPSGASAGDSGGDVGRQIVYVVRHSDALYQVGWLAYEGPQAPFGPEVLEDLESIGCELPLGR